MVMNIIKKKLIIHFWRYCSLLPKFVAIYRLHTTNFSLQSKIRKCGILTVDIIQTHKTFNLF